MSRRLRRPVKKDLGAFVERFELLPPPQPAPPKAPHPLRELTFAVADIFDIIGYVTGFGNPDWVRTHDPASRTSAVVSTLINEGATCVGKTVIDEFAYSNSGENKHFGMPTNPAAPDRIPGGCSSGSAVAVASDQVDFSLGVDTIGGVRVPAGFCGILGFRPSLGAVSNIGVLPVAPGLDTIGWFAKDPSVLHRVGHVLLRLPYANTSQLRHITFADDCFQFANIPTARVTQVVTKSAEKLFGKQRLNHINLGDYLSSKVPSLKQVQNGTGNGDMRTSKLISLARTMLLLEKNEFQTNYKEWIDSVKPVLDSCISADMSEDHKLDIDFCQSARNEMRSALNSLLKDDGILVLPTALGPPPKRNSKEYLSEDYQIRSLSLLAIASMSGCCQVSLPLGFHEKCPVSVSFIARLGGDRFLLNTLQTMYACLQEQADIVTKSNTSNSSISKEESAEIAKEKGNAAFKEKQWQKAISLYSEAIKLSGKNATYYSNRAAAYLEMGSYLQAEADCSTAIDLDKKNVKAYLRRGTARETLGYYKEAMEDFKYALVLEPTNKTAITASNKLRKFMQ